eukprot:COSAG01_NODE_6149_length_3823_cov_3.230666_1_plen_159_part_00
MGARRCARLSLCWLQPEPLLQQGGLLGTARGASDAGQPVGSQAGNAPSRQAAARGGWALFLFYPQRTGQGRFSAYSSAAVQLGCTVRYGDLLVQYGCTVRASTAVLYGTAVPVRASTAVLYGTAVQYGCTVQYMVPRYGPVLLGSGKVHNCGLLETGH